LIEGKMLSFRRPSVERINSFLQEQRLLDFTYEWVGATAANPPNGYLINRIRERIGAGSRAFDVAASALEHWKQFDLGWLEAAPRDTPIRQGAVIAILARLPAIWCLNACRIVYVIRQVVPLRQFGFGYGTLPDHMASGEERFLVEMDETGNVWYDVLSFSLPRKAPAKIAQPLFRRAQRKFAEHSARAMRELVRRESAKSDRAI
jgi:uncharacterized protein (UPF0548 family)